MLFSTTQKIKDRRELLVPWIIVMCADIAAEFVHFIFLLINQTVIKYVVTLMSLRIKRARVFCSCVSNR